MSEDCVMWSMVGTKIYKKCAQVYKLEERIKELETENKQLLELSENLNEHPEGYNGPCSCQLCKSYG